jgi:hypothetical protein
MPTSRRTPILTAASVVVLGLFALAVGRFFFAGTPDLPAFAGARPPQFPPLSTLAEQSPQAEPLRGRLVDAQGSAVADALVYARPLGVPTWDTSDAEGRFELFWPQAAGGGETRARLAIAARGFPPVEHEATRGPEELVIALPEREPTPPPLPRVRPAPLAGRVVPARADDAPPYAYEILLVPVDPPEVFGPAIQRRALCDPDGRFALADLAAGGYRVHVLPAWAAGGSWPDVLGSEVRFEHDPANPRELVLALAEGAIAGTLTDRRGRTIEGALLLLTPVDQPGRLWPPATSDPRGGFLIEDLPAGSYRLFVEAGDARVEDVVVEVRAGQRSEVAVPALVVRRRN